MKALALAVLLSPWAQLSAAQTTNSSPVTGATTPSLTQTRSPELDEADKLNASVVQLYREGRYEEALPGAHRALALREKVLKDEDPAVGAALHNLLSLYIALGDADKAESLCERILARREQAGAPSSKATLSALSAYACILSAKGRLRVGNGKSLSDRINRVLLQDAIVAAGLKPPADLDGIGTRTSSPRPSYPAEAKSRLMQGSVFVVLNIDERGMVESAEPLACGPALKPLGEAAAEAARRSKFAPVSIAGKPIKRQWYALYNFVLGG